jgi:methylated-DNA-[protein]-cysteine S-methyltransferase
MKTLHTRTVSSPVGGLVLIADGDTLVGLEFGDATDRRSRLLVSLARHLGPFETREHDDPAGAATRLARYFSGERHALAGQAVGPQGTAFQREVWGALLAIPAGETRTYAGLAAAIGRPAAVRAVGAANGANPVALFVPCHRVIAADGTLWGYGGGLARKRWLLAHEGATFRDAAGDPAQGALPLEDGAPHIR